MGLEVPHCQIHYHIKWHVIHEERLKIISWASDLLCCCLVILYLLVVCLVLLYLLCFLCCCLIILHLLVVSLLLFYFLYLKTPIWHKALFFACINAQSSDMACDMCHCCIATTEYSVQERLICCIGPYSRASLKPNFNE